MKKHTKLLCVVLAMLSTSLGCGGDSSQQSRAGSPAQGACPTEVVPTDSDHASTVTQEISFAPGQQKSKALDPALGTAEIRGVVKFPGKPPKRRKIDMDKDEVCVKMHEKPMLDESAIVNPNGTLRNAFVWVKKGLEGWSFAVPKEPVVLDQRGCCYVPHVFGIMAGQQLKVRNSDDTTHNIHALGDRNAEWNFSQTKKGMEELKAFQNPEVMLKVKCDIHGWMNAYAGVTSHPYYAVTGEDGAFRLAGLPPGEYTIEAWHEMYGTKVENVRLSDKESKQIDFLFEPK